MAFHTVTEELRLGSDQQTFLRTFAHSFESDESAPREEVFALFEFPSRPNGIEQAVNSIFAALREICFLDRSQDPYERFETALKEVNAILTETRDHLPNRNLGRVNAVIGFVSGKELHLTQAGDAEAYLIRKGTLTTITEGLTPDESAVDFFVNIASGRVENHDKILFGSERLLRYATKNELTKIFSPNKEVALGLEELDEIIVLEGAQTTGVLGIDIVTPAAHARLTAEPMIRPGTHLAEAEKYIKKGLTWIRDRLPEGVHIPGSEAKLNVDKNYIILGFLVAVILVILSISFSLSSKSGNVKLEEVKTVMASIEEDIDVARMKMTIGNKETAHTLLAKAAVAADDLLLAGIAVEEAQLKKDQITAMQDELDDIRRYRDLTPTVDLTAADKEVSLVGLVDYHDRKIGFDAHRIFETTLDQIDNTSVIDETAILRAGHYFGDRDALLFLTTDGKVIEWRDGETLVMDTADEAWKSGIDVATYSSYIYLLDPVNNQIWKYNRQRDSYSAVTAYNENADLTKAVALAIDGDLWVLANDNDGDMSNDIIRIRKGERKPLAIKDLPEDVWVNPSQIYTTEDLRNIYVLDQENSRVLRFYKDPPEAGTEARELVYDTQYLFEGMDDIRDFWVDSAEQKMHLVNKNGVYEVTI